jgi:hypothetical protein
VSEVAQLYASKFHSDVMMALAVGLARMSIAIDVQERAQLQQ